MTTKTQIRAKAQSLCFRACMDCKSANECDPDDAWIKEAGNVLEANEIKRKSK